MYRVYKDSQIWERLRSTVTTKTDLCTRRCCKTSVFSRHDGTVEDGIIVGGLKSSFRVFGSTTDVDVPYIFTKRELPRFWSTGLAKNVECDEHCRDSNLH